AAPVLDEPHGVADAVGARGTGGDRGLTGSLPAEAHRHRCRPGIRHHHRHEERRDPVLALAVADLDLLLEGGDATDAGADDDPGAGGVDLEVARFLERHRRGRHRELREAVGAPRLLAVLDPGRRVPVGDRALAPDGGRPEQAGPVVVAADATRRDDADSGDGDATTGHQSFEVTRSNAAPTVSMPSSSSSSTVTSNSSSSRMTSSTRSRLSASRSSANRASRVTCSASTARTSTAHCTNFWKFSSLTDAPFLGCARMV